MSPTSDLDEGEGWSRGERLHFMLHLVLDVLLHALMLIDVLLLLHVEEDSGRHGDGNGILRFWLHAATRGGKSYVSLFALHFSTDEPRAVTLCGSEQPVFSCSTCDCELI